MNPFNRTTWEATDIKVCSELIGNGDYPLFIGVSSDTLAVIAARGEDNRVVDWILQGVDTDGLLLSVPSKKDDDFLDALNYLKELIEAGIDPKSCIKF